MKKLSTTDTGVDEVGLPLTGDININEITINYLLISALMK